MSDETLLPASELCLIRLYSSYFTGGSDVSKTSAGYLQSLQSNASKGSLAASSMTAEAVDLLRPLLASTESGEVVLCVPPLLAPVVERIKNKARMLSHALVDYAKREALAACINRLKSMEALRESVLPGAAPTFAVQVSSSLMEAREFQQRAFFKARGSLRDSVAALRGIIARHLPELIRIAISADEPAGVSGLLSRASGQWDVRVPSSSPVLSDLRLAPLLSLTCLLEAQLIASHSGSGVCWATLLPDAVLSECMEVYPEFVEEFLAFLMLTLGMRQVRQPGASMSTSTEEILEGTEEIAGSSNLLDKRVLSVIAECILTKEAIATRFSLSSVAGSSSSSSTAEELLLSASLLKTGLSRHAFQGIVDYATLSISNAAGGSAPFYRAWALPHQLSNTFIVGLLAAAPLPRPLSTCYKMPKLLAAAGPAPSNAASSSSSSSATSSASTVVLNMAWSRGGEGGAPSLAAVESSVVPGNTSSSSSSSTAAANPAQHSGSDTPGFDDSTLQHIVDELVATMGGTASLVARGGCFKHQPLNLLSLTGIAASFQSQQASLSAAGSAAAQTETVVGSLLPPRLLIEGISAPGMVLALKTAGNAAVARTDEIGESHRDVQLSMSSWIMDLPPELRRTAAARRNGWCPWSNSVSTGTS